MNNTSRVEVDNMNPPAARGSSQKIFWSTGSNPVSGSPGLPVFGNPGEFVRLVPPILTAELYEPTAQLSVAATSIQTG